MEQAIVVPVAWNLLCPHCHKPLFNPAGKRTWVVEDVEQVTDDTLACSGCGQSCST